MEIEDYIITHLGEGKFQVKVGEDEVKEAGSNLCGMVRYTYFEDYALPEIGWEVTRKQLMQDYLPKMLKDASGKFNPN